MCAWESDDDAGVVRLVVATGGKGIGSYEVNVNNGLGEGHVQPQCVIGCGPTNLKRQIFRVHYLSMSKSATSLFISHYFDFKFRSVLGIIDWFLVVIYPELDLGTAWRLRKVVILVVLVVGDEAFKISHNFEFYGIHMLNLITVLLRTGTSFTTKSN